MEAYAASAVASELVRSGSTPTEIEESSARSSPRTPFELFRAPVALDELVIFSRQMHTLVRSGVDLIRALQGIAQTSRNPTLQAALLDITESLRGGRDLASALERHPRIFSRLYVSSIFVGESTGRLEEAFRELALHLERESQTLKRIKSALRYPTLVVVAVAMAIVIINLFVVPGFSKLFAEMGGELPLPTRILIGTSDFFVSYWPLLLVGGIGGSLWLRSWLRGEKGRYFWHRCQLRLPVVGSVLERATLARFARSFALSFRAGVPAIQALRMVAEAVGNAFVCERVGQIAERVSRGETLAASASASGLFTPLVLQMIHVGEESGALDELLEEAADHYEREVDHDLRRLSDAIEPILIVVLGGVVLLLALGVYLPLWDMASLARQG